MIKKKYDIVDVKGWYHIQKSYILIWKHNLNKSTHISLNLKLKTLNNLNINNIMLNKGQQPKKIDHGRMLVYIR
jgi:hypothetical protein